MGQLLSERNLLMIIATIDNRHPITIALAHAFKTGRVAPDREMSLCEELQDLVVESAKKFVGFKNIESVRKALDITLGILSLAVVHSTKGKEDPEAWAEFVVRNGLKTPIGGVIQLVKEIADTSDLAQIESTEGVKFASAREYLLTYAMGRDEGRPLKWNGYNMMLSALDVRKKNRQESELARWFIQFVVVQSVEGWLQINRQQMETAEGGRSIPLLADEVTNNLIFRYCSGLPLKGKCILKAKDFRAVHAAYMADKNGWTSKAKKRYAELAGRVPLEFQPLLLFKGRDWFTRFLAKGPPAVPKKAEMLDNVSGNVQGYHVEMFA